MIDLTEDIHSMTKFKRNSSGLMKRMRKTGRPLVLTVKGKAEAVVRIRKHAPLAASAWIKGARKSD